jgi:elongation factor P--(R)-beta-lysine ligase
MEETIPDHPAEEAWRPVATRTMLETRATLLARVRCFFAARNVLEVDTPLVVNAGVTDLHIHSARVVFVDAPHTAPPYFIHTSPEYAMKRLLAAGSGDIYQICHVVRGRERGRWHNAEFTLVEWYRVKFSLDELMDEVGALIESLLGRGPLAIEKISYREAFLRELKLDPLAAPLASLAAAARDAGYRPTGGESQSSSARDELLEFLLSTVIGPQLGRDRLTFVQGYPASQAVLARIDPRDPRTALRFEAYCQGLELANGFHELAAAAEQRARFMRDNDERSAAGLPQIALDERLLAALESGLPDCTGVALGFDRVLMLATGATRIDEVMPFPLERA